MWCDTKSGQCILGDNLDIRKELRCEAIINTSNGCLVNCGVQIHCNCSRINGNAPCDTEIDRSSL